MNKRQETVSFTISFTKSGLHRALGGGIIVALVALPTWLIASQVGSLTSFTAGTPIRANEVNANFAALRSATNDNHALIADLQAQVDDLAVYVRSCAVANGGCDANATCTDTPEGTTCTCNLGYTGDGLSCSPYGPAMCLDGVSGLGSGPAMNVVSNLSAATVELWFRSDEPDASPTNEVSLLYFHPTAYVGGSYPVVNIRLQNAENTPYAPALSGRFLLVAVDGRGGPQGLLNHRGFDIDATLPGFDERTWHHYAVVFTGTEQRAFIDGKELTLAYQPDGTQASTFASAFGPDFEATYGPPYLAVGAFVRDNIRFLHGAVADIRVSSAARYSEDFTPVFRGPSSADTIQLVPIDEGSGTVSTDTGAGGYDITWSGGYAWCE